MPWTWWPAPNRRGRRLVAMKPAAPVTTIFKRAPFAFSRAPRECRSRRNYDRRLHTRACRQPPIDSQTWLVVFAHEAIVIEAAKNIAVSEEEAIAEKCTRLPNRAGGA